MKDKLIELLEECDKEHDVLDCFIDRPSKTTSATILADYLIANNVVVREKGVWIPSESDFDDDDTLFDVDEWCDWQCSACREDICYEDPMERKWLPKYCPNCGADMRGAEHESN